MLGKIYKIKKRDLIAICRRVQQFIILRENTRTFETIDGLCPPGVVGHVEKPRSDNIAVAAASQSSNSQRLRPRRGDGTRRTSRRLSSLPRSHIILRPSCNTFVLVRDFGVQATSVAGFLKNYTFRERGEKKKNENNISHSQLTTLFHNSGEFHTIKNNIYVYNSATFKLIELLRAQVTVKLLW